MAIKNSNRPEIAYLVQNILPVFETQYDFPSVESEENTRICEIPVRMGSSIKKPDVVYYNDGVPVFLVEAKREDKSEQEAIDQALSYIRNYPVDSYSKDGIRPRLFAVTIGRLITFYKHRYDIDERGVYRDWPEKLNHHLHFDEVLREYGLANIDKKETVTAEEFRKEIINELVAIYRDPEDDAITPAVVQKTSAQILSYLRDGHNFVSRQPYVSLDDSKDRQVHIRRIFNRYDLPASAGPELAREFRSFILRSFQGGTFNQYLTEQCVIAFMMDILGTLSPDMTVLDFECGSGGFLAATVERGQVSLSNVKGVDIDELPYVISKTYMALYFKCSDENAVDGIPVIKGNGLYDQGENWDLVIGNPAGSSKYEHSDLEKVLKHLSRDLDLNDRDDKFSEYNFSIQRAVISVRVGGKICLILPEGVFSNSNDEYLRKFIIKHCKVLAIIGLPRGAFKRGTSTRRQSGGSQTASMKMSILYAEKISEVTEGIELDDLADINYPVFLSQIDEPESSSGQICDWLEPRLAIAYEQWKQWKDKHELLDIPMVKVGKSESSKQIQNKIEYHSEAVAPEKPKDIKSDITISGPLKNLFGKK